MTIGGFDLNKYASSPLTWHTLEEDAYFWELELDQMQFEINGQTVTMAQGETAILDCGTSINLMPKNDRDLFVTSIEKNLDTNCWEAHQVIYCTCDADSFLQFPDLKFYTDGAEYYLPRDSYVTKNFGKVFGPGSFVDGNGRSFDYAVNACTLDIMTHETIDIWILGLNFHKNYYTVYDQTNMRVGLALSSHADERITQLLQMPNLQKSTSS